MGDKIMLLYMFKNTIATLFLSTQFVLTMQFDSPIEFFTVGVNKLDLYSKISNDRKTLVLKRLTNRLDSNMVIVTKNGSYQFYLKKDQLNPHTYLMIKNAKKETSYKYKYETDKFKLLEASTTYKIINTSNKNIKVNNKEVFPDHQIIITKGARVVVNKKVVML
jgi:hypothetical protein